MRWLKGFERVEAEITINFTANEMPLTRLSDWFNEIFPGQISVPADRADELISITIMEMKLGDLIEAIGLTFQKPLTGRSLAGLNIDAESGGCGCS